MSTTTNFKRIALVAVAALGLGVLSSVPSNAAITGTISVTNTNGTATTDLADSTTAGSLQVRWLATVNVDSVSITTSLNTKPAGSNSPLLNFYPTDTLTSISPTVLFPATRTVANNNDTAVISGATTAGYMAGKFGYQLNTTPTVAGTYTYTLTITPFTGNAAEATKVVTQDVSIVVTAPAASSTVAAPGFSVARLLTSTGSASADSTTAEAASVSLLATASSTASASVFVRLLNAAGTADRMTLDSLTVSIDKGNLATTAGTPLGKSIIVNYAPTQGGTDGGVKIFISPDGTAGPATVTIATKNAGTFTKTFSWYSAAAKTITATVATPLLRVGTNDGAVRGVAVDANGSVWTGTAYIVASSAADALIAGSTTPVSCGAYDAVNARHNCNVPAIAAGTAKFKIIDAATVALATATSNEVTVTVSSATAASVKIEFDKATYAPNERARIYITPLSAAGAPIQSGTYTDIVTSTGVSINGALSFSGTTTTADSFTAATAGTVRNFTTAAQSSATTGARAGSAMFTVYMPSSGGTVTLNATGGSSLPLAGQVALVATASVTDSGAAALAAVTALATTVASLRTLIVTLTNLVLKIQKKVRA